MAAVKSRSQNALRSGLRDDAWANLREKTRKRGVRHAGLGQPSCKTRHQRGLVLVLSYIALATYLA